MASTWTTSGGPDRQSQGARTLSASSKSTGLSLFSHTSYTRFRSPEAQASHSVAGGNASSTDGSPSEAVSTASAGAAAVAAGAATAAAADGAVTAGFRVGGRRYGEREQEKTTP